MRALLGTRFTMSGPVYAERFAKHAVKITSPAAADQRSSTDISSEL